MKTTEANPLLGDWKPVRSEIPGYDLESELLHFTEEGSFLWEHPKLENQPTIQRFTYLIDATSLFYGSGEKPVRVAWWIENGLLVLQPVHGYKTHWQRIETAPRPIHHRSL